MHEKQGTIETFDWKTSKEEILGQEGNIETNFKEKCCEDATWAFVNITMNFWVW
jgi:hypothetical protein